MKRLFHWPLILALVCLPSCTSPVGKFSIQNKASEAASRIYVLICDQEFIYEDVRPESRVTETYQVVSDSHFVVRVEFEGGREIEKEDGYVTNGVSFDHKIIISDNGIILNLVSMK